MLVILVAAYNQAQFADDCDCNVYSRKMCCRPWLQHIFKRNMLKILAARYTQAQCSDDSCCNVCSNTICWWFWL